MSDKNHRYTVKSNKLQYCCKCNREFEDLFMESKEVDNYNDNKEKFGDYVNRVNPCITDEEAIIKKPFRIMAGFKHEISNDYSKLLSCLRCGENWGKLYDRAENTGERRDIKDESNLDYVNRISPCTVSDNELLIKKLLE